MDVFNRAVHSISWCVNARVSNSSSSAITGNISYVRFAKERFLPIGRLRSLGTIACTLPKQLLLKKPRELPFNVLPGGANLVT